MAKRTKTQKRGIASDLKKHLVPILAEPELEMMLDESITDIPPSPKTKVPARGKVKGDNPALADLAPILDDMMIYSRVRD